MPLFPLFCKYEAIEGKDITERFAVERECSLKIHCTPGLIGRIRKQKPYTFRIEGRKGRWYYPAKKGQYRFQRKSVNYSFTSRFNRALKQAYEEGLIDQKSD